MPAPVSWPGTPTEPKLWASFPGGVGAPNVSIPLNGGGARRSRRNRSRKNMRKSRKQKKSRKSRKSRK